MKWYKFTPADTLFFKGSEPMNMGENHTVSNVFPPPEQTITGALRTAALVQNHIPFNDYGNGKAPDEIIEAIGEAGKPSPFQLTGPLFLFEKEVYIPAPYTWFIEKDAKAETPSKKKIVKGKAITSRLIKSSVPSLLWAKGQKNEMQSIGGNWIKAKDLNNPQTTIEVKKSEDFFVNEPRTGIALDKTRKVRDGHLYSFTHSRLKENTTLLFGTDLTLPLNEKGVLRLGGEQRFGWYEVLKNDDLGLDLNEEGRCYLALTVVEGTKETNKSVIAAGKILYFGGWDLKKGFHKPMEGFFPAGSVFDKKFNNCIAIKGVEEC